MKITKKVIAAVEAVLSNVDAKMNDYTFAAEQLGHVLKAKSKKDAKLEIETLLGELTAPAGEPQDNKGGEPAEDDVERINITDAEIGDIIRYPSSKKMYIVADKKTAEQVKGTKEKPYLLLVSKTQSYKSTKQVFEVVRVLAAAVASNKNGLTAKAAATKAYTGLVSSTYKFEKNTTEFNELVGQANRIKADYDSKKKVSEDDDTDEDAEITDVVVAPAKASRKKKETAPELEHTDVIQDKE